MQTTSSVFSRLYATNVNEHIEKKGAFSYLSWPFAVAQLRLADPTATWEVRRFDGLPFLRSETGYFVEVSVTVQGITLSQIHPVLDAKNKVIPEPSAFDINTSTQRALVKAIALHGLGLYIYAGEDLPESERPEGNAASAPAAPKAHSQPAPRSNVTSLPGNKASAAQLRYIERLLTSTGYDRQKLLAFFNVASLEELTAQNASRAIQSLEKQTGAAA